VTEDALGDWLEFLSSSVLSKQIRYEESLSQDFLTFGLRKRVWLCVMATWYDGTQSGAAMGFESEGTQDLA